ncbi:MAG: peptidase M14 [Acidimicrobiia bacterium]|nr:peptidase M14 [Acidimicrobiia bacterium]
MCKRFAVAVLAATAVAAVPTPKEHLGYEPGADYKLADYAEVTAYFQKLAQSSPRIKLEEFGKSSLGKPIYVAYISSEANLKQLDKFRDISRKLALGIAAPEEARLLSTEGKAVVWIDSGLHASEVAPVQHSFDLAYRMLTSDDPEIERIRRNVILMQIPVINPDGLDWVVHWYRKNVGTPYELAPLPWLYHKYAGHDNNRDWFMFNLPETRHVSRLLFQEWFPHIVYNQHQAPAFPARIFVPPYAEPLNPRIPATVMEGINVIGSAMKERFAREGKTGVISYTGFDAWWNGGLRSVPAFHNMHGILTETALFGYATPGNYKITDLPERFSNGIPTREPTVFYQKPWLGGKWGVRDAIEYMLTADFAILDLAAWRPSQFLYKSWEMARSSIDAGKNAKPYAYIVPSGQWDDSSAIDMLRRLKLGGVQVHRAASAFRANGKQYPAGSHVLLASQPFRPYLVDLMEPHKYPELRSGGTGAIRRPYDVAGWTLWMNMGVQVDRTEDIFQAQLEPVSEVGPTPETLDHRQNASFLTTAALLERGRRVRWAADGEIVSDSDPPNGKFTKAAYELRIPRLAVYEPFTANMDTGWTQFLLDSYEIPHALLRNDDILKGDLTGRFDSILLASQSTASILHGLRDGEYAGRGRSPGDRNTLQRPEYTGGIGLQGLAQLEKFVRGGGTLITLDNSTELPAQFFPLPVRSLLRPSGGEGESRNDPPAAGYYSPGSLIRIQVDTAHPLAFGMPKETYAFTTGGQAWDITLLREFNKGEREIRSVARYANSNLLASGWLSGESTVQGKHILVEARHGQGRVILFGFRPQFRGQSAGTFKLLLNAIYLASAKTL